MTFAVIAGIASGLLTALVFRLTTDTAALRILIREIQARFLEFRLFFDEPRLIWRAQKALLWANLRALGIVVPSVLVLAAPMIWLILQVEKAPLRVGEASVVTVQLTHAGDEVALMAPPEIAVETPPVHITEERQIVWRIRLLRPITGAPRFTARPASNVAWLKIDYPEASRWLIFWFLVISSIATVVAIRSAALQRVQCVRLLRRAKDLPRVPPR